MNITTKRPSPKQNDAASAPRELHISLPHCAEPKLPNDPDIQRRHLLIEVLISRHEKTINGSLRKHAQMNPAIGEDAIRSTFLFRLTRSCLRGDFLLNLQDQNLQPLEPERERRIILRAVHQAFTEEARKQIRNGRSTKSFSQLDDYDSGEIPDRAVDSPPPSPRDDLASELTLRLQKLNIKFSDRQFKLSLFIREGLQKQTGPFTYQQIAEHFNVSPTTVRRDIGRMRAMIYSAQNGATIDRSPDTTIRREEYKKVLASGTYLAAGLERFMRAYVEKTKDGQRPNEQELCATLGINENQLKSLQRRAKRLCAPSLSALT
jgi:hypothetical protein